MNDAKVRHASDQRSGGVRTGTERSALVGHLDRVFD